MSESGRAQRSSEPSLIRTFLLPRYSGVAPRVIVWCGLRGVSLKPSSPKRFFGISETAWELKIEEGLEQNPQPWLNWFSARATMMAPSPLNAPVSSDIEDDKFIECALAAGAEYIISRDRHLLRLEKPFGIRIVDDREFLTALRRRLTDTDRRPYERAEICIASTKNFLSITFPFAARAFTPCKSTLAANAIRLAAIVMSMRALGGRRWSARR